jgi:hypothetical protein
MLTGRGELNPGVITPEQLSTKTFLHRFYPGTDGRLGNIQVVRGTIEITAVGDFQKGTNMLYLHAE